MTTTESVSNAEKLRTDFERDGCLVIPGFLTKDELAELEERAEGYLNSRNLREKTREQKNFQGTYKGLDRDDEWFEELLHNGQPAGLVSRLLNADIKGLSAAFFERLPEETKAIDPHFDAIGHRSNGATIWIALDRATVENGCLYYARGSHKQQHENIVGISGFDESTEGAFPVELQPGDAAVHHSLTVHWSRPNQTQHSRRGVVLFYLDASSNVDWSKFKKTKR